MASVNGPLSGMLIGMLGQSDMGRPLRLSPSDADSVANFISGGDAWVSKDDARISPAAREAIDGYGGARDGRVARKELSASLQAGLLRASGDTLTLASQRSGRPTPPLVERPLPPPIDRPLPPPVSHGDRRAVDSIVDMTLQSFNRGMSYSDATQLGQSALRQIRDMGPNPVADYALRASDKVNDYNDSYDVLRGVFDRREGLMPDQSPAESARAIAAAASAAFGRGMSYSNAVAAGNAAMDVLQSLGSNPVPRFAKRAAERVNDYNDAYDVLNSTLSRPETLDPHASRGESSRAIARIALAAFSRGLSYANATAVGEEAVQTIMETDSRPELRFALDSARRANNYQDSYQILRSALERI